MPADFEWTIGPAPEADDPSPVPAAPGRWHAGGRRFNGLIALLIAGTVGGLWCYNQWRAYQQRQSFERVVMAEDRAAGSGEIAALWRLGDPSDWGWRQAQLRLAENHQPAPLPVPILRLSPNSQDQISLLSLGPDAVRADVTRAFVAPDGAWLQFTLPQFYHFSGGQWMRVAPPADGFQSLTRTSALLDLTFDAGDADLVEKDLGPYLDDVLSRACAAWGCPLNTRIRLSFATTWSKNMLQDQLSAAPDEPLLYAFARSQDLLSYRDGLVLSAPQSTGYPAGPASGAWFKRTVAIQVLSELGARLTVADPNRPSSNAFLYALVERLAARLGLEAPQPAGWSAPGSGAAATSSALAYNVNAMWDLGLSDNLGQPILGQRDHAGHVISDNDPELRDEVTRRALAVTDWLLRDQPPETDGRLLRSLAGAPNQTAWLSRALSISPEAAWARLQLAVWQLNRPAGQPELALGCDVGAALAEPGQPGPVVFWGWQRGFPGSVLAYSPNGTWLALDDGGQPVIVNLTSAALADLPTASTRANLAFHGWISNSVAAFIASSSASPNQSQIVFIDMADPKRPLPTLPGLAAYVLSPNKALAAVVAAPDAQAPNGLMLEMMPAWGGRAIPIDESILPAAQNNPAVWAPNSQSVAYTHIDPASGLTALRVADATTGLSHDVLDSQDFDPGFADPHSVAWSPDGRRIAFTDQRPYAAKGSLGWLDLVNADGTGLVVLRRQTGEFRGLGFSADGKYLAATFFQYPQDGAGSTVIYDTTSGREVNPADHNWSFALAFAWSPTGHQLALIDGQGVSLIPDVEHPTRQRIASNFCRSIAWNPAP